MKQVRASPHSQPHSPQLPLLLLAVKLAELPAAQGRIVHLDLQHDGDRWRPEAVAFAREWVINLRGLDGPPRG